MIPQIEVQIQISFSPFICSPFRIRMAFSIYLCCVIFSLYLALKQEGYGFNFVWSCHGFHYFSKIQPYMCVCWVLLCLIIRNIQLSLSNLKKIIQRASLSSLPRTKDEPVCIRVQKKFRLVVELGCFTGRDRAWIHEEWLHEEESGVSMMVWHSVQYSALKLTPSAGNSD